MLDQVRLHCIEEIIFKLSAAFVGQALDLLFVKEESAVAEVAYLLRCEEREKLERFADRVSHDVV